ncbi:EF hand [Ancylostoma duodenale]|uniref:EF hand n=1 Tax=Ancylostoma duodenale TaxID=51022 RepID=A0A0C2D7B2_9BILA|nr:EF hand [Ancylostoma duodenale]
MREERDFYCEHDRISLEEHNLSETFDLLDIDKDGRLSRNEIAALLRTVKVEPTRVELDFIFKEMDADRPYYGSF